PPPAILHAASASAPETNGSVRIAGISDVFARSITARSSGMMSSAFPCVSRLATIPGSGARLSKTFTPIGLSALMFASGITSIPGFTPGIWPDAARAIGSNAIAIRATVRKLSMDSLLSLAVTGARAGRWPSRGAFFPAGNRFPLLKTNQKFFGPVVPRLRGKLVRPDVDDGDAIAVAVENAGVTVDVGFASLRGKVRIAGVDAWR